MQAGWYPSTEQSVEFSYLHFMALIGVTRTPYLESGMKTIIMTSQFQLIMRSSKVRLRPYAYMV